MVIHLIDEYVSYSADTNCYRQTDGRTKYIPIIPSPLRGGGLKKHVDYHYATTIQT